ncbi:MAG TPA: YicC/YloC family endoribonuclease [Verrucomicrobiae bacterium]|nr:YicC/YloC family endoribonuclease [Verrucomicrobiae bacterium]
MIRSMTAYGKGEVERDGGRTIVEVRSVNHRYGEVSVKLPRNHMALEHEVRKIAGERLKRGKIDLFVQVEERCGGKALPAVDLSVARAYLAAFETMKQELGVSGEVSLPMLASQRDVLTVCEEQRDEETAGADIVEGVRRAVEAHLAMRSREGAALLEDILDCRGVLMRTMERIRGMAPVIAAEQGARLRERVAKLLGEVALDEARLAQEIALLADRSDITEEIVRFGSHFQQFDEALTSSEPVGRKLDFLIQEMNREVNTIGSKANDAALAALVVEMKAELEKIREQVQNVE